MNKKLYIRGIAGQCWYNFTEGLVYALITRPTPKNLTYTRKIKYGSGKLQYINTYCLKCAEKEKKPLLIYIHGGSWLSGITEMRNRYIAQWAQKGYFTAAVGYTYAPQKLFPAQIQECFSAIDYISEHAEEWNIDLNNVVLAGESAGGYFISHVASAMSDYGLYEKTGITFKSRNDIKIKAMVSLSGCFNFERLLDESKQQSAFPDLKTMFQTYFGMEIPQLKQWLQTEEGKLASPKVTKDYPPMFFAWAVRDLLRFESFDMVRELREHNIPYDMFKSDDISGQHAWTIVPLFKKSRECFEKAYLFADKYISLTVNNSTRE